MIIPVWNKTIWTIHWAIEGLIAKKNDVGFSLNFDQIQQKLD